jgi:hypothetical protein
MGFRKERLSLSRETVRELETARLEAAAGGTAPTLPTCGCIHSDACPTVGPIYTCPLRSELGLPC